MKFGCCAPIADAGKVAAAGFDYLECTVVSLEPLSSEEEFAPILRTFQESPIPVEACNIFLPGSLQIVGDNVDMAEIERYVASALARVRRIGADTVVFGSGRSRSYPEGFDRSLAEKQIRMFLSLTARHAAEQGITIVIEPLNQLESNIINSLSEAVAFVKAVDQPSMQMLADFYHMEMDQEPLENITAAKDHLRHVHVADSGRLAPGTGSYPYAAFAEQLHSAGYDGRVSIECKWNDFTAEAPEAVEFLRRQLG